MRQTSRRARMLSGALILGGLASAAALAPEDAAAKPARHAKPAAAVRTAAPAVSCASPVPGLADRLERDITAALDHREGTVAVGLADEGTSTSCALRPTSGYDSASIVKVTVLAALLWDAEQHHRTLTEQESALARAMITESDNKATSALWKQLGPGRVRAFLQAAGMHQTVPGEGRFWGLTRVTVHDEQRLLALITGRNPVLGGKSRAVLLDLMAAVVPSQRWGTPFGAPAWEKAHLKNGWLEREQLGWRVHSIGAFEGAGHAYTMTVLTHGNRTFAYGVDTIQGVARAVHRDLAAANGVETASRVLPVLRPSVPPALLSG